MKARVWGQHGAIIDQDEPVEIPLSHHAGNSDPSNAPYYTPRPHPNQSDDEDQPSGVWSNVEIPSVLFGMSPVADGAEADEHCQERNRHEGEDT